MAFMQITLLGDPFADYLLTDVGAAAYELEHDWWTREDLQITTGPGGGGVPLVEGVDYQVVEPAPSEPGIKDLHARVTDAMGVARTVYHKVQIINAIYEVGDLYHSGKYIADSNSATDVNTLYEIWPLYRSAILGLTLSNNVADANNDIDIAAGKCLIDGATVMLVLSATLTKRLDAAWVEGNNQGGLDAGAKAANTVYHIWLIRNPISGIVDALFSTSATNPAMPAGYTQKRRIGAVRTDGTSNIRPFIQDGDWFWMKTPILDVDVANLGAARVNYTIVAPPNVIIQYNTSIFVNGANTSVYISNPDLTDLAPSPTVAPLATIRQVNTTVVQVAQARVKLDSQSRLSARSTDANTAFRLAVIAWRDMRGKDENA